MKLLIASDIHGAAGYCRDLLAAWDREVPGGGAGPAIAGGAVNSPG